MESLPKLFRSIGLDAKVIDTILRSSNKANILAETIKEAGLVSGCNKVIGNLVYNVATMLPESSKAYRPMVLKYITEGRLQSNLQVTEAVSFLKKLPQGSILDIPRFEKACGIGVSISDEKMQQAISTVIDRHREELLEKRYTYPINRLLFEVREGEMKWADGKKLKELFDSSILSLLGEQTEEDRQKATEGKKKKKANRATPEGFTEARYLESAKNSAELIEQHLKITGGKIRCRFPPEPNGYLHIGHAKSMYLNFKGAFERLGKEGETLLRFDDTNPETEKDEFIESIMEDVQWLGWKPCKVNFGSDNFDQLYEYAIQLIKMGKAYVDHQTPEEIKRSREIAQECSREGGRKDLNPESPWRNRSVEENLRLFEEMRQGKFAEGEATLRMKIDMRSPDPCMWDPVAYRIKHMPHPHVGDKWCIYPSYDFQHCLVDSIEHIDYSLCTLEFETRRKSYYWLVNQLNVWRAYVWEFGRLNLTNTVMSKRKLKQLVETGIVHGWDDPRMPTIKGLRRRGYTPEAINNFCADISVSRTTQTTIDWSRLEHFARSHLDTIAPRAFAVLNPVPVVLVNRPEHFIDSISAPLFPAKPDQGSRSLPYQKVVYVDREDVKMQDEPKFLGLAPGKIVSLKYADVVRCEEVVCEGGSIKEVRCRVLNKEEANEALANKKSKLGSIHWLAGDKVNEKPRTGEVRLYDKLFTVKDPLALPNWESGLNPTSEIVIPNAMLEASLLGKKWEDHVQFERLGYFVVDKENSKNGIVYNRTCSLRNFTVCLIIDYYI